MTPTLPSTARPSTSAFLALSILVIVVALQLGLPTRSLATSRDEVRHCSNAGTPEDLFLADITARGVTCPVALRFIIGINGQQHHLKYRTTHYDRYVCHPRQEGVAARIRCTRGRQEIRWLQGT